MDIKTYDFQETNYLDTVFSILETDKKLLKEAEKRGFYNGDTPYNQLFSELFFQGGTLNLKKNIDNDFSKKAVPYLKALMRSFEPKHEEKKAVSALLLSELVEI